LVGIIVATKPRKYKTGDPHPVHNSLAFVEYCEHGKEIWTSVGGDSEAPHRLAKLNAQRRSVGMRICHHNEGTLDQSDTSVSQRQSVQDGQPNGG